MTWNPRLHPRDPHTGEFTDKPGGGWVAALLGGGRYRRVAGRDLTGQAAREASQIEQEARSGDHGDPHLKSIATRQGWDTPPAVGSRQELDQAIADGAPELFRGVAANGNTTPDHMLQMLQDGQLWYGNGIYGNGVYTSVDRGTADEYGGRSMHEIGYSLDGGVMRFALDPNARVLDWTPESSYSVTMEAGRNFWNAWEEHRKQAGYGDDDEEAADRLHDRITADPGLAAAVLGYDVIHIRREVTSNDGGVGADQYIVLNPTALLVQRDLHERYYRP